MHQTEFFVILDHFLPFHPPNNLKHQTFEKIKKTLGDIITLHMCTINGNHLMYGSWDMECDRQIFVILDCFLPFTPPPFPPPHAPPTNPKNQIFENMKTISGDIILHMCTKNHDHIFYTCVPQIMIICYTVP